MAALSVDQHEETQSIWYSRKTRKAIRFRYTCEPGTVRNRSESFPTGPGTLEQGPKHYETQFCSIIYMYSWGIPCARNGQERSGTVPNGSWLTGFVRIAGMFWHFLVFQYEEPSCRKHDRNTEQAWLVGNRGSGRPSYQQDSMPHDRRKASAKAANIWHAVAWSCAPRAYLRLHAACKMSGAFCALLGSISEHLEHCEWCEWPTAELRNTSTCLGFNSLFLGVLCLWDARLWGKVAGGSIYWVPACLITSQTLLRDKFPNIVSKVFNIVSKIETFCFQDVWYRFQHGFWPTDKEATGRSNVYRCIYYVCVSVFSSSCST